MRAHLLRLHADADALSADPGAEALGSAAPGSSRRRAWNVIGRSSEEIARAREDWMTTDRFGEVHGYAGPRLPAPPLPPTPLKPRGPAR